MRLGAARSGAAPGAVQVRARPRSHAVQVHVETPCVVEALSGGWPGGWGGHLPRGPLALCVASLEKCLSLAHFKTEWFGFCCFGSSQYFGS